MKRESSDLKVGSIMNLTPVYPKSNSKEDMKAGRIADLINNKIFINGMVTGEFSQDLIDVLKEHKLLSETKEEDLEIIKVNVTEFTGVNYYKQRRVQAPNKDAAFPAEMP